MKKELVYECIQAPMVVRMEAVLSYTNHGGWDEPVPEEHIYLTPRGFTIQEIVGWNQPFLGKEEETYFFYVQKGLVDAAKKIQKVKLFEKQNLEGDKVLSGNQIAQYAHVVFTTGEEVVLNGDEFHREYFYLKSNT